MNNALKLCLKIALLCKQNNETQWTKVFDNFAASMETEAGDFVATDILRIYSGAGSFNDLVLHKNGIPLVSENNLLDKLRRDLYQEIIQADPKFKNMPLINFIQQRDAATLTSDLKTGGFAIYELDTTGIDDLAIIYQRLISVLPVGFPLSGNRNWDAFLDSVWEGIIVIEKLKKAVLVWHGSASILDNSLSDFTTVVSVLENLSQHLQNDGQPTCQFFTIFVGDRSNFK